MRKLLLLIVLPLLAACPAMPPKEEPRNFIERVAYWEGQRQGAIQTVDQLTCHAGYTAAGACREPGKPLRPALALEALRLLGDAGKGMRAAASIPETGVGLCWVREGDKAVQKPMTGNECLVAATNLLLRVETQLQNLKGGQ